jgi:hypothetical protein
VGRVPFGLAWFLCALCVCLAAGSLIFAGLNDRTFGEILLEESLITLAVLTVAFCVVGALVASHRPGNSLGWIFCSAALCQGLSNFGFEYATYALLTRPGSLPLGAGASWLAQWVWAPGLGLILVFVLLLFPDGRPPSRRWRPVAWLGGLSVGLASVSGAFILWPERGPALVRPEGPREDGTSAVLFVVVERTAFPLMLVAGFAAVVSLLWRFGRAREDERQQIKWFSYAAALTLSWTFVARSWRSWRPRSPSPCSSGRCAAAYRGRSIAASTAKVRRGKDACVLLGKAARRDGPRDLGQGSRGGGG